MFYLDLPASDSCVWIWG